MGTILQAAQDKTLPDKRGERGHSVESPATINVVCGSGLEAVNMAARMVLLGRSRHGGCRWYGEYVCCGLRAATGVLAIAWAMEP